jgi:hypothetical protein
MHGPINVKTPNNTSKWQMGFNSAFKELTCIRSKFYYVNTLILTTYTISEINVSLVQIYNAVCNNCTDVFRVYTPTDGHSDFNKTLPRFRDAPIKI